MQVYVVYCTYLDEGDLDVVLDMRVPVPHVAHDEVAELAAELHSGGASADHHAVQEALLLFLWQACSFEMDEITGHISNWQQN
jgi:hypothetical protein